MRLLTSVSRLRWLLLILGVVLSPLRAVAATRPMLIAYDGVVRSTATARVPEGSSVGPERGGVPQYAYDDASDRYGGTTKPCVTKGAGAVDAYDDALNVAGRREAAICDGPDATTAAEALVARAEQIHAALDPIAQDMRVTAVLDTSAGQVVASGGRDLAPAQRALLEAGEMYNNAPGVHAEVTSILGARQIGAQLQAIGTTADFCTACAAYIEQSGGVITGPRTAVWPQ